MLAPMGRRAPSLREELLEARARLSHQIELLEQPVSVGVHRVLVDNAALIAELVGVRDEIDLRLSELGPDPIGG
jgi:hypothetical protein